jgi:uncharacterized membrane protein YkvA (DUF1232 family)
VSHQPDLFLCPAYERILGTCLPDVGRAFKAVYKTDLIPASELVAQVETYLVAVESSAEKREFVDVQTARLIAEHCRRQIELIVPALDGRLRRLIQAAVLYFVLEDDGEPDTDSVVGFDDDLEIVELVKKELELELSISIQLNES